MQNAKCKMQNENSNGISAEVQDLASVQVVFPNRKTADEVVKELWKAVDNLQKEINELKSKLV